MSKKTIIPIVVLAAVLGLVVMRPAPKRESYPSTTTPSVVVAPVATAAPAIVAPPPARQIPAKVEQSMQKALEDRQEKLRHLAETPLNAEKK